jgi:gliding motility-associated-like protein
LCQGSLGDPIVHIDFGQGNNPGPPLSAATTSYQYMSVDCPNDGQYAVRNRTDNCYTTWHTLPQDHTGNQGGYFMLVNASFQPSAFYIDTVDVFCGNTVYEFAAWAINMMKTTICSGNPTIAPNLTFSIEEINGTVLQSYNTGNIPVTPSPTWNQYGFFFSAPTGVTRIVLRITNNAPGGCGNDIAIDDITFRPCGPQVTAVFPAGGDNVTVCRGSTAQYTLSAQVSNGFDDPVLQWQLSNNNGVTWADVPGAINPTLSIAITPVTPVATYMYRLSVVERENQPISPCRVHSGVLTLRIVEPPTISFVSNSPLCENNSLQIEAQGGTTYQWSGPNSFTSSGALVTINNAQTIHAGKYYVTATDNNNCTRLDSITIDVNPRPTATALPAESTICEGETVNLTSTGGLSYEWQPATGLSDPSDPNPIASPVDTTDYRVIVSNAFDCRDTAYATIYVNRLPVANAGPDQDMFEGEFVVLTGTIAGTSVNFEWTPNYLISDPSILNPTVKPLVDTNYILSVSSTVGCGIVRDTVRVNVFKGIFVPTAFSPNNDGLNDVWKVPGLGIFSEHEVLVFNRYGEVVFSTKNNSPWDGRYKGQPQPAGLYPYLIKVKERNLILKGWIVIVR